MAPNCPADYPNLTAFMGRCLSTLQTRWTVSSSVLTKPFQVWVSSADCQVQKEPQVHEQASHWNANEMNFRQPMETQVNFLSPALSTTRWQVLEEKSEKERRCRKMSDWHTTRQTDRQIDVQGWQLEKHTHTDRGWKTIIDMDGHIRN